MICELCVLLSPHVRSRLPNKEKSFLPLGLRKLKAPLWGDHFKYGGVLFFFKTRSFMNSYSYFGANADAK